MQGKARCGIFIENYKLRGRCNCIIYPDGDIEQSFVSNIELMKNICKSNGLIIEKEPTENYLVNLTNCVSVHYDEFVMPEKGMNVIQRISLEELLDSKIIRLENNNFFPKVTKNY